jgi:hypothetical protein
VETREKEEAGSETPPRWSGDEEFRGGDVRGRRGGVGDPALQSIPGEDDAKVRDAGSGVRLRVGAGAEGVRDGGAEGVCDGGHRPPLRGVGFVRFVGRGLPTPPRWGGDEEHGLAARDDRRVSRPRRDEVETKSSGVETRVKEEAGSETPPYSRSQVKTTLQVATRAQACGFVSLAVPRGCGDGGAEGVRDGGHRPPLQGVGFVDLWGGVSRPRRDGVEAKSSGWSRARKKRRGRRPISANIRIASVCIPD